MPLKILIADDEKDSADLYAEILRGRGHQVAITYNGEDCITEYLSAFDYSQNSTYNVVIIDYSMPDMSGVQAAKKMLGMNPKQQIIFISGYGSELLSHLNAFQNVDLLTKPIVPNALIRLVEG
jgi:CheY-like chemotaxis protein